MGIKTKYSISGGAITDTHKEVVSL